MSVWQRGTSFAVNAQTYTADRWVGYRGAAGMTVTRQPTSDTTNLPNIQYCMRVARDSGNASTGALQVGQMYETVNAIPYAGKTVTLSFYARAGANYSAASGLTVYLITGTGTDQNYFTAYTGAAFNGISTTLTTTWQRFTGTFAVPAATTEFAILAAYTPTGTAGANDYFEFTGVQLEQGSVANTYQPNQATYQGELAACQRYYIQYNSDVSYQPFAMAHGVSADACRGIISYPVTMRTSPSFSSSAASTFQKSFGSNPLTAVAGASLGTKTADLDFTRTAEFTANYAYLITSYISAAAYLTFSAEL